MRFEVLIAVFWEMVLCHSVNSKQNYLPNTSLEKFDVILTVHRR